MENKLWSRRDRTQLVKDILLILYQGSMSKTKLQNLAGLNKRLFETYVENVLVRYGLVEKRSVGRTTYYMLTPKGRTYLYAMIVSDIEVLMAEEEFAERVSKVLSTRGVKYARGVVVGSSGFRLPVDFEIEVDGRRLYIYLAATSVSALVKHCAAAAVKRLIEMPVVLVAPEEPEAPIRGENGFVPVLYYRPGSPEHAAVRIMEAVAAAGAGRIEQLVIQPSRRALLL